MKKFISNLLSLVLAFALLGSNIVSANFISNGSLNNGIVSAKLMRNMELTLEHFKANNKGYFTVNNIQTIEFYINFVEEKITLYEDLEIVAYGKIEELDKNKYMGVFETLLDNEIPLIITATFTNDDIFVVLTAGYLGYENYEVVYFGQFNKKIKEINDLKFNNFNEGGLTQNNELLLENGNNSNSRATGQHQGGKTVYTGNYSTGYLNVYHKNQIEDEDEFTIWAKVNTNSVNMRTYLVNYVYTTADIVYVMPETFNVTITGKSSNFEIFNEYWLDPISGEETVETEIYYIDPTTGLFDTLTISFVTDRTTAYTDSTYSGATNKAVWEIYKAYGWNSTRFDATSLSNANNSSNSMGVKLRIEYDGTHTTNITTNIETRATIRYIVRTITGEESQSPVYYARTGEMKHVTNLTVTPKN